MREFFENGYGVSIISDSFAYTDKDHPFELAVLKGDVDKWAITYDTPITNDVIGYLNEKELDEVIEQVKALPKEK